MFFSHKKTKLILALSISIFVFLIASTARAAYLTGPQGPWTSGSGLIYYNDGNVGIGTTAPDSKLTINGDINIISESGIYKYGGNSLMSFPEGTAQFGQLGDFSNINLGGGFGFNITDNPERIIGIGDYSQDAYTTRILLNAPNDTITINSGRTTFDGNVGISTTNPTSKLTVVGAINSNSTINGVGLCISGNCITDWQDISGSNSWSFTGNSINSGDFIGTINSMPIIFKTNNVDRGRFTNSGNFVLGAEDTGTRLHVESTQAPVAFFKSTINGGNYSGYIGNGQTFSGEEFGLYYALNDTRLASYNVTSGVSIYGGSTNLDPGLVIDASTNIGIGLTNPQVKLHVNGGIRANSLSGSGNRCLYVDASGNLTASAQDCGSGSGSNWTLSGSDVYRSSGNVGIGATTFPSYDGVVSKLRVLGASNTGIVVDVPTGSVSDFILAANGAPKWHLLNRSSSGDRFELFAGGAGARLVVLQNGNVGIGTTNPTTKISVSAGAVDAINAGGGHVAGLNSTPTNADHAVPLGYLQANYSPGSSSKWSDGASGSIYRSSNVGIGTSNPGNPLEVKTASNDILKLNRDGWVGGEEANILFSHNGTYNSKIGSWVEGGGSMVALRFYTVDAGSQSQKMVIRGNGNVGIGTTAPAQRLSVSGVGTSPSLNTVTVSNASLFVSNSDIAYGTYLATMGSGDGMIQQRRQSSAVYYNLLLNPFGGNVGIGTTNLDYKTDIQRIETVNRTTYNDILAVTANANTNPYSGHGGGIVFRGTTYRSGSGNVNYARIGSTLNDHSGSTAGSDLFFDVSPLDDGVLSRAMTIKYSGNIGVGTTAPGAKLEVASGAIRLSERWSSSSLSGNAIYSDHNSRGFGFGNGTGQSTWFVSNGTVRYAIGAYNDGSLLQFYTNNTERMRIISSGNVGIGITNPTTKLSVSAGAVDAINVGGGHVAGLNSTPTNADHAVPLVYLQNNYAPPLWSGTKNGNIWNGDAGNGNVGIGTSAPESLFEAERAATGAVATFDVNTTNRATVQVSVFDNYAQIQSYGRGTSAGHLSINPLGNNVGIGTTNPTSKLHVVGNANITSTLTMGGNINLASNNIIGVNKLTVNTIDPLYNIKGVNYSTFASAIVGGVKEEYIGRIKVVNKNIEGNYESVINFPNLEEGSDLWVWYKTVDFSSDNVEVLITPVNNFAQSYYLIKDNSIIFRTDRPSELSYRLVGKRIDWREWPTKAIDQEEKAGFFID